MTGHSKANQDTGRPYRSRHGGSRGIGRAAALALVTAGADVAVNFQHREAEAKAVCREIEGIGVAAR